MKRALTASALAMAVLAVAAVAAAEDWRPFAGTWTATGQRQTLPTEGPRPAAIVQFSGSVVLTNGEGLSRGFRGDAIGFTDGDSLRVGRFVWTDENGDQVFGTLAGELLATGQRIVGVITGGKGRYDGLSGDFAFLWQYAVQAEDGALQGRGVSLEGRVRRGEGAR